MMPAKAIKKVYSNWKPAKRKTKQLHCNQKTKEIYKPLITTYDKKKCSFRKKISYYKKIAMNSTKTAEKRVKATKNEHQ